MRALAERAWFVLSLILGRLLRGARYASARVVRRGGGIEVRKHRLVYAPILVWLGGPLATLLDTGVRVLAQRDWEERERLLHRSLRGAAIGIAARGELVLPYLPGRTLAAVLDDRESGQSSRRRAIELAVVALAELHRLGFTHGDAMAENVMVDLDADVAHWFDFETLHESRRPMAWRRADDVRALLATTLLRTAPDELPETLRLILDAYADEEVTRLLVECFAPLLRRALPFHLGQAALPLRCYREIACALRAPARAGAAPAARRPRPA